MHGHEERRAVSDRPGTDPAEADRGPLRDLVVLDLTIARAGPTAVRYLADWGARVLRIEPRDPGGQLLTDHENSDYLNLHRSKGLIQLDLRDDTDRREFFRLVEHADVVVENNRAPVKAKLGIDYEAVSAVNPRIVYGSISGYGQDGPASAKGAVDQIIQGAGGLMSITGPPGAGPVRAGIAVSDSAAGHQLALGIMIALYDRQRTGRGQWVKVSLLEAMISFLDFQAVRYTIDGRVPETEGNHHPTARPMGTYRAADGHLNLAAPGDRLWDRLCDVLDDPALRADERFATPRSRYHHRDELNTELDARLGTRTRDEWIELLDAAGIPCGPVNAMDEVFADPQVQHLAMLATVDHATRGPVDVLRNPITMTRSAPVVPTAAPMPGADPGEVLDALGIPRPG
jgi:crotonobetainyl-CoA:carnitine CoA-transferase CaiB-like acyl-CoA transferase